VFLSVVFLTSVWLVVIVAVVGLCASVKSVEAQALTLPRGHGRRRTLRLISRRRRPACAPTAVAAWRPARRV